MWYVTVVIGIAFVGTWPAVVAVKPSCQNGALYYEKENICIGSADRQVYAKYAKYGCAALGGALLKTPSRDILKFVHHQFKDDDPDFWIGLSKVEELGYVWMPQNTKPAATFWAPGQPNTKFNCTALDAEKEEWSTAECNSPKKKPLCAIKPWIQDKHCPQGYAYYKAGNTCVTTVQENMVFEDARLKCLKLGGNLVKISDSGMLKFLEENLKAGFPLKWAGLRRNLGEDFKWISDNSSFGLDESVWDSKPELSTNCALISKTKLWPIHCTGYRSQPMCERKAIPQPEPESCQDGWSDKGSMCYKVFSDRTRTWSQARSNCKAVGGDLAAVPNAEVLESIKGIVGKDRYWIGLHIAHPKTDMKFRWLDETKAMTFTAWNNKPKNIMGKEFCAELIGKKEGRWNDKVCNAKRFSICQKTPGPGN